MKCTHSPKTERLFLGEFFCLNLEIHDTLIIMQNDISEEVTEIE